MTDIEPTERTATDIWRKRGELEKARRDHMKTVMAEYDKFHYAHMKQLREDCERLTGHTFRFSHLGPLGDPWSYCTHCGTSKVDVQQLVGGGAL